LVVVLAIVLVLVFTRSRNRSESGQPIAKAQNPPGNPASAANVPNPPGNTVAAVKVRPDKEGETWKSADLLNYLRSESIKLSAFGKPYNYEGGAGAESLIESLYLTDDESAAARAPNKPHPTTEALAEQKNGIGLLGLNHYRSAEHARQLPTAGDESALVWGRFIITVVNPKRKKSGMESGNLRSRKLIQQIRKALGLPVVPVE
jgi:hypothetical protein